MFDLVYDFCVFVVEQLDPVLSIGAGIELATPGSAVRLASVARHVTDVLRGPIVIYICCEANDQM